MKVPNKNLLANAFEKSDEITIAGVPDGMVGKAIGDLLAGSGSMRLLFIARDGQRIGEVERVLRFFAPDVDVLDFPAWDCVPYDRVSPHAGIVARRMATLAALTQPADKPQVILSTVNAVLQRVPVQAGIAEGSLSAASGGYARMNDMTAWLERNGFLRSTTVREPGEYAVRGGILDLYPAGFPLPVRLDFFGDSLESIRTFDPETQMTIDRQPRIDLVPVSEMELSPESIARFRKRYLELFGAADREDLLYHSVSDGRRYVGMEHWLPLFADGLETIFDHVGDAAIALDHLVDEAAGERLELIGDHYQARVEALENGMTGGTPYKPLKPDQLYLTQGEWSSLLRTRQVGRFTPFALPDGRGVIDIGGRASRSFAPERSDPNINVFEAAVRHIESLRKEGKRPILACWSEGSRDRMGQVLADHGVTRLGPVANARTLGGLDRDLLPVAVIGMEAGFEQGSLVVIGEQDILGDRLVRPQQKRRAANFLSDAATLAEGDLVVHIDHGIGRFTGLKTITAAGAPHDCLELTYAGGDRVYLPVENIELLSRYGSEDTEAALDKLGGVAWQSRKAKLKKRIREMAAALIKIAAARLTKEAPVLTPPDGAYDEFAARFPFEETEDQQNAIDATIGDLGAGRPMDRLICGDVGFGKTEVALRAAFVAALSGRQVAVVVPTTLLARQHYKTFATRFAGLPVKVAQASRLVSTKELNETKAGLKDGSVDIVVGTHALLGKGVGFRDLGLLIVDEEQHFGVKHKERLKQLKADVHVLTLSATPIPRTLQLALTGVRELSLITTPPVDRMAVRTFISPFDPLVVREALLRERYRGGQSFYVCPRVSDLAEQRAFLAEHVPEVKVAVAHGQMAATELEEIMNAFYDGAYDVLLSTTIVESGLDIPTANTLIVHRAEMFGLAQLYQIRGRVGRSKQRAYALFTVPPNRTLTATAERRLKVLQSLDTLGAGFQLASHDLDIRGAGNLLGEEQSGHIKEVGFELYQQMLEEAVASLKAGETLDDVEREGTWSPQITVGMAVMIPEGYVADLQLRLNLYKRLADLENQEAINAFAAELIDRFGALPEEVKHLLELVAVKALCRRANVEKVDVGPKGVVIAFRDSNFANPAGLLGWLAEQKSEARIRPDQTVVFIREWKDVHSRLRGITGILRKLVQIAEGNEKAAA